MASAPRAVHYTSYMELFGIQSIVQGKSVQADVKKAVIAKQILKRKGMKIGLCSNYNRFIRG